jgi:leukotriene-A4 hydrolase
MRLAPRRCTPRRCTPLRAARTLSALRPSAAAASPPSRAAAAAPPPRLLLLRAPPARLLPPPLLRRTQRCLTTAMASASAAPPVSTVSASAAALRDPSSLSNPRAVRVTHSDLVLAVDFPARRVAGSAALRVRAEIDAPNELVLDTRDLAVTAATWHAAGEDARADGVALAFALDAPSGALGAALRVALPPGLRAGDAGVVTLRYATSPASSACQWLTPEQARARACVRACVYVCVHACARARADATRATLFSCLLTRARARAVCVCV